MLFCFNYLVYVVLLCVFLCLNNVNKQTLQGRLVRLPLLRDQRLVLLVRLSNDHIYIYIYVYIYIYRERERYSYTFVYIYIYIYIYSLLLLRDLLVLLLLVLLQLRDLVYAYVLDFVMCCFIVSLFCIFIMLFLYQATLYMCMVCIQFDIYIYI